MTQLPPAPPGGRTRRRAFCATAAAAAALAPMPARAATRFDSRARFELLADFSGPPDTDIIVPWDSVLFQHGPDITLQPTGKLLINTHGLYEFVFSSDWQLSTNLDIDLRQIGLRLQRKGQPDEPVDAHERIGFFNTPGSDPPRTARYQGDWGPLDIPLGATVGTEVAVLPAGTAKIGDMAMAAHTKVNLAAMPLEALRALQVHAKVVANDTVSVSLHNPSIAEGIHLRSGTLKVVAMTAQLTRGNSGDAWQLIHTASFELFAGDRVYSSIRHKIAGTVLQVSNSTYLQVDRVA
jgi:hypothetical protein